MSSLIPNQFIFHSKSFVVIQKNMSLIKLHTNLNLQFDSRYGNIASFDISNNIVYQKLQNDICIR